MRTNQGHWLTSSARVSIEWYEIEYENTFEQP